MGNRKAQARDADMQEWIHHALALAGLPEAESIEQTHAWALSRVLRVTTVAGDLYFKAVPPVFAPEPSITAALWRLFPGLVPEPVAVDPQRGYMLMRDMGGQELDYTSVRDLETVVVQVGEMQRGASRYVADLFAAGCGDRRPETMPAALDELLSAARRLNLMASHQLQALEEITLVLQHQCEELASAGIPSTLVHGDLHLRNVRWDGDHVIVFDWTDACISHPFFDQTPLLFGRIDEPVQPHRDRLSALYLDGWRAQYREVDRVSLLSRPLGALFQVLNYRGLAEAVLDDSVAEGIRRTVGFWVGELLRLEDQR